MPGKKKTPSKPKTTLGVTKISVGPDGEQSATYIPDDIPTQKEERELHYAEAFIRKFNTDLPFGPEVTIDNRTQNDTSDIDFNIECQKAVYLELAAIKPLTEIFGKDILKTGKVEIFELARWIYEKLIRRKFEKYGELSGQVFLLIYPEDWQFLLNGSVLTCVASLCKKRGCDFSGVFSIMLNPMELVIMDVLYPNNATLPNPEDFKGKHYWNLAPGQSGWTIKT